MPCVFVIWYKFSTFRIENLTPIFSINVQIGNCVFLKVVTKKGVIKTNNCTCTYHQLMFQYLFQTHVLWLSSCPNVRPTKYEPEALSWPK